MKQPFSLVLLTPLLMAAAPGSDYPSLNDTFGTVRCIVHELADDGTRAETVAYVEDFRNRFFGGLEVIDATRCEEQVDVAVDNHVIGPIDALGPRRVLEEVGIGDSRQKH